jgi:ribosomal protein S18 acetylase RimI-like enzyme
MQITIREAGNDTIHHLQKTGSSFEINSKLVLSVENGRISYTIMDVTPHTKKYWDEEFDSNSYLDNPDKVAFFACLEDESIGQIRVKRYWNAFAYIEDITVEPKYRRQGVGRALMERAIAWSKMKGFPGVMLETQDNNVAGCHLYAGCGFKLYGFDTYTYKGLDPSTEEIALFWYLIF